METIVKLSRRTSGTQQTQVTIPADISRQLEEGGATHVTFEFTKGGTIIMRPLSFGPVEVKKGK